VRHAHETRKWISIVRAAHATLAKATLDFAGLLVKSKLRRTRGVGCQQENPESLIYGNLKPSLTFAVTGAGQENYRVAPPSVLRRPVDRIVVRH